jgi:hypothetical protein
VTSVEAQIEADELLLWAHWYAPLDLASVLGVLTDGLAQTRHEYRAARTAGDCDRADARLLEIVDLIAVTAACREGLDCQRARWLASGKPWPLGRLAGVL